MVRVLHNRHFVRLREGKRQRKTPSSQVPGRTGPVGPLTTPSLLDFVKMHSIPPATLAPIHIAKRTDSCGTAFWGGTLQFLPPTKPGF